VSRSAVIGGAGVAAAVGALGVAAMDADAEEEAAVSAYEKMFLAVLSG
jgi:hypothetical protein